MVIVKFLGKTSENYENIIKPNEKAVEEIQADITSADVNTDNDAPEIQIRTRVFRHRKSC